MTIERYADWLARGRTHQAEGKVIDALLCYRRALRETSGGIDARFHVGEIAWHLGNPSDAIAAWETAARLAPKHLPSLHALSEALAASGRFDDSLQAADRVLSLQSSEPRASALSVLLRTALGHPIGDAQLAGAVQSNPRWPLALLGAVGVSILAPGRRAEFSDAMPAVLDAAFSAAVTPDTADELRVIALALAAAGDHDRANAFADRYAQCCQALHRPAMPPLWPIRSAGRAVRIGLLAGDGQRQVATRLIAALTGGGMACKCECSVLLAGPSGALPEPRVPDARTLPMDADEAVRAVAALDLDVLIDVAGLRAPTGPLLARHPARKTWAVRFLAVPLAGGLAERIFDGDSEGLIASLRDAIAALHGRIAGEPECALRAAELTVLWEDAVRAHERGDVAAARIGYAAVLDAQPGFVGGLYLSGVLMRSEHDVDRARELLQAAVRIAPDFVDARAALVDLEVVAGNAGVAAAVARQGLESSPDAVKLWRVLGQAELKQGDAGSAAGAFGRALQLDPSHGETHYNHGVALQMARDAAEAARAYQRALAFRPDLDAADFNLGVIFEQLGNAAGAIAAFSSVLEREPTHVAAYKALAETLLASGRIDAWFANFQRFERHCPNHIALAAHALEVCAYRADFGRLTHYLEGLRNERFPEGDPLEVLDALQQILYLLHFFDVEPELIGRFARTHDALAKQIYGMPRERRSGRVPGRLRVGYLSGDFRNHVMGKMVWHALCHHDRDRFDVFGYSTAGARDDWTERYQSIFSRLTALDAMTDADAASRIDADDLDVLVDLSTHTKGARPGILALKPARVQITHVASAGTLAMSTIDFKLTDRFADVDAADGSQIEQPLVMDGCVYPFRHVSPSPADTFTREKLGIAARAVLIGAFCTPLKLSQRCLALWRDVLLRLPEAMLAFSPLHPSLRTVFQHICAAAGIEPRRVAFVPQGRSDAENQARYRLIDFVLDPLPYGGVNGTLEALDMHVPVVTLVGRRHGERSSFSILSNLGIVDTIAHTGGDYVEIAVRLATDSAFMRSVRAGIKSALADSALTDMPAHARNLERAYVEALERCAPAALIDAGLDVRHA